MSTAKGEGVRYGPRCARGGGPIPHPRRACRHRPSTGRQRPTPVPGEPNRLRSEHACGSLIGRETHNSACYPIRKRGPSDVGAIATRRPSRGLGAEGLTDSAAPNEFGKSGLPEGIAAVVFGLPGSSDATAFGQVGFRLRGHGMGWTRGPDI